MPSRFAAAPQVRAIAEHRQLDLELAALLLEALLHLPRGREL
jgi:hypothetical protein